MATLSIEDKFDVKEMKVINKSKWNDWMIGNGFVGFKTKEAHYLMMPLVAYYNLSKTGHYTH